MRWKKLHIGDMRDREGFLFFPKSTKDDIRWLEYAKWTETFNGWKWTFNWWNDEDNKQEI